jgi:hypothetical protein
LSLAIDRVDAFGNIKTFNQQRGAIKADPAVAARQAKMSLFVQMQYETIAVLRQRIEMICVIKYGSHFDGGRSLAAKAAIS